MCPCCTASRKIKAGEASEEGFLKFRNFRKFVELNPEIRCIELSRNGEVFLNPELDPIIEHAYTCGIELLCTGANFNYVTDRTLECLVKYQFKYLRISIDGASGEIYEKYRRGGNFTTVIKNIEKLNEIKRKYSSPFPQLVWQFIIFGHNEHEIPAAKQMAAELGMKFTTRLNWIRDYSPVIDREFVMRESGLPAGSREEFRKKFKKPYFLACASLLFSPQISWDGQLHGCCNNRSVSFGNVFETPLKECLKSRGYRDFQRFALKSKGECIEPCRSCTTDRQNTGRFLLTREFMRRKFPRMYRLLKKIRGRLREGAAGLVRDLS